MFVLTATPYKVPMSDRYKIASWIFDADVGTLTQPSVEHRLEHRAARLLELLCQTPGEVVTHDTIIEQVWDGRVVSPNSIAVVIADIRKALGDPAREPRFIETLPKRGYRLLISPEPVMTMPEPATRKPTRRWAIAAGAALIAALAFFAISNRTTPASGLELSVSPMIDETGESTHEPLRVAVSELILVELMRDETVRVVDAGTSDLRLESTMILWNDHPAVSLKLLDGSDETIWSGMAGGPADKLPGQIRREITELLEHDIAP